MYLGLAEAALEVVNQSCAEEICMRELISAMQEYDVQASAVLAESIRAFILDAAAEIDGEAQSNLEQISKWMEANFGNASLTISEIPKYAANCDQ